MTHSERDSRPVATALARDASEPEAQGISVLVGAADDLTGFFINAALLAYPSLVVVGRRVGMDRLNPAVHGHRPDVTIVATSPFLRPAPSRDELGLVECVEQLSQFMESNSIRSEVLVLDHRGCPEIARKCFEAGARGVIGPDAHPADLGDVVAQVANGTDYVDPSMVRRVARDWANETQRLSWREVEVVRLVALGYTNTEVAEELCLSIRTIESHRARIMDKLDARRRADLVAYALDRQIIP